jgi:hypothetical protein
MEIANIFWHGELTKLEIATVKSYINHGFKVKLWSYTNLQIDGAESCNANEVLPDHKMFEVVDSKINGNVLKKSKATTFSDMFRYYLLKNNEGWWFDADAICLKNSEEFKKLREKEIVAGYLEKGYPQIANGVLHMNNQLCKSLVNHFEDFNNSDSTNDTWGHYGPSYITKFLNDYGLIDQVLPYSVFYAINWNEFDLFTDWQLINRGKEMIKNSYITHVWNTEFELRGLDKNNPPIGSLLEELINK